jgi:glycerol-3-phosphate acyltransferase PlsY
MLALALIVAAYLAGSVPFGLLVCRALGTDVRQVGSGNIGATNVARAVGKRWAALVLICDMVKGLVPTLAAAAFLRGQPDDTWWIGATMLAAVCGHVFSVFLRLRGGKGVATALGATSAVAPLAGLVGVVIYVGLYLATRISAIGSLGATLAATVIVWLTEPPPIAVASTLILLLIALRHRENLQRLLRGEEHKV